VLEAGKQAADSRQQTAHNMKQTADSRQPCVEMLDRMLEGGRKLPTHKADSTQLTTDRRRIDSTQQTANSRQQCVDLPG
jgi:hypothetical protein